MKRIFLTFMLMSTSALADDLHLLDLNDASVFTYKNEGTNDTYLYPDDQGLGLGMQFITNFDIIKYKGYGLYMNNNLHFDQEESSGQVRTGGWHYQLGLVVWQINDVSKIEIVKEHESDHIFDRQRPGEHFPTRNRTGIMVNLYHRSLGERDKQD